MKSSFFFVAVGALCAALFYRLRGSFSRGRRRHCGLLRQNEEREPDLEKLL